MSPFKSPNYIEVPTEFFDDLLWDLSDNELRVALALIRINYSFPKLQVEQSIEILQRMIGKSRIAVKKGIDGLRKRGILEDFMVNPRKGEGQK